MDNGPIETQCRPTTKINDRQIKILFFISFAAGDEQICAASTLQVTFSVNKKDLKKLLQTILGTTKILRLPQELAWNFRVDISCLITHHCRKRETELNL